MKILKIHCKTIHTWWSSAIVFSVCSNADVFQTTRQTRVSSSWLRSGWCVTNQPSQSGCLVTQWEGNKQEHIFCFRRKPTEGKMACWDQNRWWWIFKWPLFFTGLPVLDTCTLKGGTLQQCGFRDVISVMLSIAKPIFKVLRLIHPQDVSNVYLCV